MRRGTTPELVFECKDKSINLEAFTQIWLTISGAKYKQTFDINELRIDNVDKKISIRLTQEQTLMFPTGTVNVQLRFRQGDRAYSTGIMNVEVNSILNEGVIE